jgi:glycine/D-amino acid oxidase-like deaminating enzyme
MKSYDVLIVGRGIAGNTLALTLLNKGLTIQVVDLPQANSPSRLAAGLYSPFTGKKTAKTWLASELFPFLENFYQQVEQATGASFLYIKPAYRPFLSVQDYNEWIGSGNEENSSFFLNDQPDHAHYSPWIRNPFGGIEYKHSGYVDTVAYLDAGERILNDKHCLQTAAFQYSDLEETTEGVIWKNNSYRYVVFCEGCQALKNPFFPNVPIIPNKGEIITLSIPTLPLTEIVTQGVFLVQKQSGVFRVGSTYRWTFDQDEPEERGAMEIQEKLNKWLLHIPYEQIDLQAGIRPASKDRRPLMGYRNERPRLLIFNGLGTKGVSLAPYWAEELSQLIIDKKDLPKEVDIRRFYLN